jgi:hypothetical protein
MTDLDEGTLKGRTRFERVFDWAVERTMTFFAGLSSLALLFLTLMVLLDGITWLLHMFGVGKAMPGLLGDEGAVVLLAGVVISLLLLIARGLGRILDRVEAVEDILSKLKDKPVGAASRDNLNCVVCGKPWGEDYADCPTCHRHWTDDTICGERWTEMARRLVSEGEVQRRRLW